MARETAAQKREREAAEAEEARQAALAEQEANPNDDGSDGDWNDEAAPADGIASAVPAQTDRQTVGLDPVDVERHAEQSADRSELTNMQTDHEAAHGLDATSGTPHPGIALELGQENATLSVKRRQHGQMDSDRTGLTDSSGRPPMPSPLDTASMTVVQKDALARLDKAGKPLSPLEMGVTKSVLDPLVADGTLVTEDAVGGKFFPDTGVRYKRPPKGIDVEKAKALAGDTSNMVTGKAAADPDKLTDAEKAKVKRALFGE